MIFLKGRVTTLVAFAGMTFLLASIQVLALVSGVFRLQLSQGAAGAQLVTAVVVAVLLASRLRHRVAVAASPADPSRTASPTDPADRTAGPWLWIVRLVAAVTALWALGVWGWLWRLASARSPYGWDDLYYHVPAVHAWVQAGYISWIDTIPDIPFVNYPMGVEANTFFLYQLLRDSQLVNACNLWYWPLAFLAVMVIANELGARGVWNWLAAGLLVGSSVFVCQSVSCYVDPGFNATIMGALASSLVVLFDRSGYRWQRAVLWGASLGLMAGAKGSGAPYAVLLFVGVVVAMLDLGGRKRVKAWLPYLGLAAAVIVLVGGYWYLRAALLTGNPIYPIQLKVAETVIWHGYDHRAFCEANLPAWLAEYPAWLRMFVVWLQKDAPIQGYAPTGGMGYVWIAAGLPAVVFLSVRVALRRSRAVTSRFLFLVVMSAVLLFLQTSSWWARFTIWLHALGLPCLALVLQQGTARRRPVMVRLLTTTCLLAVCGLVIWESQRTVALETSTGRVPGQSGSHAEYVSSCRHILPGLVALPQYAEFQSASRIARSKWERMGTLYGGILGQPLDQRSIVVLPDAVTTDHIISLRETGVEWVCWDGLAVGQPPEILREVSVRQFRFNPNEHVDFHFLKLIPATGKGGDS